MKFISLSCLYIPRLPETIFSERRDPGTTDELHSGTVSFVFLLSHSLVDEKEKFLYWVFNVCNEVSVR